MNLRKYLLSGLVLVWAFALILAYYIFHKPINVEQVSALGKTIWAAVLAGTIVLLSAGTGRRLIGRRLSASQSPPLERLMLEVGLGFGVLGIVWLGLGLLGGLKPAVGWGMLIVIGVLAGSSAIEWTLSLIREVRSIFPRSRAEVWLATFVLFMIAIALFYALSPPVDWDSLLYHLTGPKENIALSRLVVDPWLPETGYPQAVEMHYTWVMLLGSPRAAGALHWSFGLLTLFIVWQWGVELADRRTGWLSCALLLSATTFPSLMGKAYIDAATIFYAAAGFAALRRWRDSRIAHNLVIAGAMAGLAFGTKYTGLVIGLGLAFLIIIAEPRRALRNVMIFGLPAVVLSAPWMVKNAILAGNPTYPFFFSGLGWDPIRAAWYGQPGTGLLYSDPWKLIVAPIIMMIVGTEGTSTWHATFGPLFLMLAPAIAYRWKYQTCRPWLRDALLFALVLYVAWLYGAAESRLMIQPRFLFPALPPLAVLSALAFNSLRSLEGKSFAVHRILGAFIALVLALSAFRTGSELMRDRVLPVLTGVLSEEDYLYHHLGWHYAAMRTIEDLSDGSRVLFLFEPRSYYCPPGRCLPDGILDVWYHARRQGNTADSLVEVWREEGVSHVLLYALGAQTLREAGEDPFTKEDWVELERLQTQQMKLVENFGDVYLLFELYPE